MDNKLLNLQNLSNEKRDLVFFYQKNEIIFETNLTRIIDALVRYQCHLTIAYEIIQDPMLFRSFTELALRHFSLAWYDWLF